MIQLYFIGDVIVVTPAIKLLKKKFPEHDIDVWLQKNSIDILKNNPDISEVFIDPTPCTKINSLKSCFKKMKANSSNIKKMISNNYEIVIDYSGYFDTALVSLLVGRYKRIGLSIEQMLSTAYSDFLLFKFFPGSKLRNYYLDALKPIGINYSDADVKFEVCLTEEENKKANSLLTSKRNIKVVIAPFAGWKSKEWPLANFIELANRLTIQHPITIFLIGGTVDVQKVNDVGLILNENIIPLMGKTQILESAAVIKKADLFIGLDSSMAYIAESFDVPSILLYGSTNSSLLQLNTNSNIYVCSKPQECSPRTDKLYCGNNTILYECRNNFKCMRNISVGEIFELAIKILSLAKSG